MLQKDLNIPQTDRLRAADLQELFPFEAGLIGSGFLWVPAIIQHLFLDALTSLFLLLLMSDTSDGGNFQPKELLLTQTVDQYKTYKVCL